MVVAAEAVERAAADRDGDVSADLDDATTVEALVDQVMKHHAPSLSARTQEEYARVRAHLDDDRLSSLMREQPRRIGAGMVRARLEAYVERHGPSSATRACALVAKAPGRVTESKRMATQVNPVRAVSGVINRKALRSRTPQYVTDRCARWATAPRRASTTSCFRI